MDTASDLDKGIELIAQNEYDAIIIDYHLPPLDGNMLEKWIRDNYQSLPPIVVLTGDHDVWIRRRCLMSGAEDFWLKVDAGNTPNQFFKAVYNAYLRRKKYVGNNETTHIQ
jgi:DNA-binding response OmpR family regulator